MHKHVFAVGVFFRTIIGFVVQYVCIGAKTHKYTIYNEFRISNKNKKNKSTQFMRTNVSRVEYYWKRRKPTNESRRTPKKFEKQTSKRRVFYYFWFCLFIYKRGIRFVFWNLHAPRTPIEENFCTLTHDRAHPTLLDVVQSLCGGRQIKGTAIIKRLIRDERLNLFAYE